MERTKLKRKVLFEISKEKNDIVFNFKMAVINWQKYHNKPNTNQLKQTLGVDNMLDVKIGIVDDLNECDETLRLYVYKTKQCNVHLVKQKQFSHALQVSLGNGRKNWVLGEEGFSAKVFPDNTKELIKLIEDIVLDIQMFYFYGYEKTFFDTVSRNVFSKEKVSYLLQRNLYSYLGNVEDAEYVSFASFCRDIDGKVDFEKYKELWENFNIYLLQKLKEDDNKNRLENGRLVLTKSTVNLLIGKHPKGGQLSMGKIQAKLDKLPIGQYALIRTEKKPRKYNQRINIENRFGMKKWKTGKVKIVPLKYRFTYQKMLPYVSIFEFEWRG